MVLKWQKFIEQVGKHEISDIQSYIDGMGITYQDKLFFLNKINPDVIVDFGCANGLILSKIKQSNPNIKLIGFDIDEGMLKGAKSLLCDDTLLSNNWELVTNELKKYKRPALLLSSVIHEVYSYSNSKSIRNFWNNQVFNNKFKWICIRDMIPSVSMDKHDENIFHEDVRKVKSQVDTKYLYSFEKKWGIIDDHYRTFIHFLLKYKYIENWEREVNENYLPISLETLLKKIPSTYKVKYKESYILPYLKKQLEEDFGISIDHNTHLKMIIENTRL
jgi:hypothetical protein